MIYGIISYETNILEYTAMFTKQALCYKNMFREKQVKI